MLNKWDKPLIGWHKLNTNGFTSKIQGLVEADGAITLMGAGCVYSRAISHTVSFVGEIWGLRNDLGVALSCGTASSMWRFMQMQLNLSAYLRTITFLTKLLLPLYVIAESSSQYPA